MGDESFTFRATGMSCVVPDAASSTDDGRKGHEIFHGVDFSIGGGEIVDLVGPSGSGKSSLLTAFARLNPHASGTLMLEGRDSGEFTPQQWRRAVAYLPQKPILPGDTVADAIRVPWTLAVRGDAERTRGPARFFRTNERRARELLPDSRIRETLDAMGCADINLSRPPHDLSGGQAARVSLARTLLTEPTVLLADEVDAGLDDENAEKVADIMAQAASGGMAIVRIRHRPPDGRAHRIATLADGRLTMRIVGDDSVKETV
ncbi:ABC transporter ATP-binding protein [Bifidobacterium catulorum]|uniref:ABC transporter ATP-binding protein n=1 Tax=Bifidobacterium catulorum TaxID=1630173 RepID=A0A2U2MSS8_9BIFI|nr:ATP-binding cassette domain-containing protein [Bifidobacterium catulorum]PWG59911.1 ABC transporter ATP-binding protein [Bifidobacterium catulorum]